MELLFERSSSWSSSLLSSDSTKGDPFSDRADIRQALKEHGFGEDIFQDLDVSY